jgi:hypothetical protein
MEGEEEQEFEAVWREVTSMYQRAQTILNIQKFIP